MSTCDYSVVIPCYRSRPTIQELTERIVKLFESRGETFEIICVDDSSPDRVWDLLVELHEKDSRIKIIRLFRNYGQHQAILTGFRHTRGKYVITMDDDLQHPPEEIPRLIEGLGDHDVVVGAPPVKRHAPYKNLGSWAMRSILKLVFQPPPGFVSSAFRLMHSSVAHRLAESSTVYPYISGMIFGITQDVVNVEFNHEPRKIGASGYSLFKLISQASNLILNYTKLPLQAIVILGIIVSFFSGIGILTIVFNELFTKDYQSGWPSLMVIVSFFGGINLISLSIIGEYIIRILNQISGTRRAFIRTKHLGAEDIEK